MNEAKHTPGPWEFVDGYVQPASIERFGGCNIARVTMPDDSLAAESRANGIVMAAAPDMLAACERALVYLTWKDMLGDENRAASLLDTLDKLRAAIAKAKGAADIPDFGCSPEAIARAEAEAEAADLNRLTGRDPHQCVRCGAVDCVCKGGA